MTTEKGTPSVSSCRYLSKSARCFSAVSSLTVDPAGMNLLPSGKSSERTWTFVPVGGKGNSLVEAELVEDCIRVKA